VSFIHQFNLVASSFIRIFLLGMGSFGAAFGPLLAGIIAARGGWAAVFYFLISAQFVAALCLSRVVYREIKGWSSRNRQTSPN
jgi:MFS family permease